MVRTLIQCVVVLYKERPEQARCLASLLEICSRHSAIADRIAIFLQDNSPLSQTLNPGMAALNIEYHHAPSNPGLADAYNRALDVAKARGIPWLLLLDQDTVPHESFLLQLLDAVQCKTAEQVCAFVPELVKDVRVCSPHILRWGGYRALPIGFSGFASEQLVPCNSASCLKVRDLVAIGGFPKEYWLDFLDFIVFHRLQAAGGRVFVLDSRLEHSLSLLNFEAEMSVARYANLLAAEWRFIKETGSRGGAWIHRLRLVKRALQHAVMLHDKAYASQTLRAVVQ